MCVRVCPTILPRHVWLIAGIRLAHHEGTVPNQLGVVAITFRHGLAVLGRRWRGVLRPYVGVGPYLICHCFGNLQWAFATQHVLGALCLLAICGKSAAHARKSTVVIPTSGTMHSGALAPELCPMRRCSCLLGACPGA